MPASKVRTEDDIQRSGETKTELVKCRLCAACAKKLARPEKKKKAKRKEKKEKRKRKRKRDASPDD